MTTFPLFDFFVDVAHPTSADQPKIILPPEPNEVTTFLNSVGGIREISIFCFPEFSEQASPTAELTRYDQYSSQFSAKYFCFVLKHKEIVIYGHCWRYLPLHADVKTRADVGRRAPHALCLLSRRCSHTFWEGVLSTIESTEKMGRNHLVQRLLEELYVKYQDRPAFGDGAGNLEIIRANTFRIQGMEFADTTNNFYIGPEPSTHILPLLRSLSLENALRLWSGLLCERKIILVSKSVERLTVCSMGAMHMLQPLQWACPYIPLLPPSKMQALHYPGPYCMGVLGGDDVVEHIVNKMNLSTALLVNLDYNSLTLLDHDASFIPDLLYLQILGLVEERRSTSVEILSRELNEILKSDKNQIANSNQMNNIARDAKVAEQKVREGFNRLKKFGSKLKDRMRGGEIDDTVGDNGNGADDEAAPEGPKEEYKSDTYVLYKNPRAELEIYRSFLSFYVGFLGNPRSYLTRDNNNKIVVSKEAFIQRRSQIEGDEAKGIRKMVKYFTETQMFSLFTSEQIARYSKESAHKFDANCSVFHQSVKMLAVQKLDFSSLNCRSVASHVIQNSILEFETSHLAKIRQAAYDLTSNSVKIESNFVVDMKKFVLYTKNFDFVVPCFVEIIEARLSDCRGLQWKHALLGLKLLELALVYGSLALLPYAHSLLRYISPLKNYTNSVPLNINRQISNIRTLARKVQSMILDWGVLRNKRSFALQESNKPQVTKETRLRINIPFSQIHSFLRPTVMTGNNNRIAPQPVSNDMLSFASPPSTINQPEPGSVCLNEAFANASLSDQSNHFATPTPTNYPPEQPPQPPQPGNPFIGISVLPTTPAPAPVAPPQEPLQNPFASVTTTASHTPEQNSFHAQPTIVSIPPNPVPSPYQAYPGPNQQQAVQYAPNQQPAVASYQQQQQSAPISNQRKSNISMFDPLA
mmetsp:Transcript_14695/g.22770  ORF Transcript_14695/g.22770 Transcript_14695/m.22770 type:complete len:923 (-) Transcript_14695:224-2992(-)